MAQKAGSLAEDVRHPITNESQQKIFFGFLGSFGAGLFVWWMQNRVGTRYSTADFVNPEAVADIAAALPTEEDEFILAAWNYVASNIRYQGFSSDLYFVDDSIRCTGCYTPEMTLRRLSGNCVAESSLLASLLRNRLPPERVLMVVGEMRLDGVGGHAWVEVSRDGRWYLLESTGPPKGWVPVSAVRSYYEPFAFFNDILFTCMSEQICKIAVRGCNCHKIMLGYFC